MAMAQMKRVEKEEALFYRHHPDGHVTIVTAWVDDLPIITSKREYATMLKKKFDEQGIEYTSTGALTHFLGVDVDYRVSKRAIGLRQTKYIETILNRYGFADAKPVNTPMDPNVKLSKDQCPTDEKTKLEMAERPYRGAVGALRYLADVTRPDISYVVGQLARYMENPGQAHWTACKRVFQYLLATKERWLVLGKFGEGLVGYADADGMSTKERHPVSGYVFQLLGSAVSWASKRQELVTLSTTEAEYVSISYAGREAIWLCDILGEVLKLKLSPVILHCDNQSALANVKDNKFHGRTKHIDIYHHWIRQRVGMGDIQVKYVDTNDQLADIFTKALVAPKVKRFIKAIGLRV